MRRLSSIGGDRLLIPGEVQPLQTLLQGLYGSGLRDRLISLEQSRTRSTEVETEDEGGTDQFAARESVLPPGEPGGVRADRILQAFTEGMAPRPETTFGAVNADVLERFAPGFQRGNFVDVILNSGWPE
jgi:hypothetical protein